MNSSSIPAARRLRLNVNGQTREIEADPAAPLLYILRNDCELNGPKYGCGLGECGACTVLVDGVAARSCVIPVGGVIGRQVTTLEGLGNSEQPGPTQQAFIDCQAAQCGYCLNGMIMTTEALLRRNPHPTEQVIRQELRHNLCRCGTHVEILQAVDRAVELHDCKKGRDGCDHACARQAMGSKQPTNHGEKA